MTKLLNQTFPAYVGVVSIYSVAWPYCTYSDLNQLLLKAYIFTRFEFPVHIS